MAWLHAIPDKAEICRLESFDIVPDFPEAGGLHIIQYLNSIGFAESGNVVSSQELLAWSELSGTRLMPWEFDMIRKLSNDYLSELHEARDPMRPMPYMSAEFIESNRDAISQKIAAQMKGRG